MSKKSKTPQPEARGQGSPRTTVAPVPIPPGFGAYRIADRRPTPPPRSVLICQLCGEKMTNQGTRRTENPFIVNIRYECRNTACRNTTNVEERRR